MKLFKRKAKVAPVRPCTSGCADVHFNRNRQLEKLCAQLMQDRRAFEEVKEYLAQRDECDKEKCVHHGVLRNS